MGGGNQFLKALREYFRKNGNYAESIAAANIVLFNSFPFGDFKKIKELAEIHSAGKVVVHRVDGPISVVRGKDKIVDHLINKINSWFTDATIFQTEWSRKECHAMGMDHKTHETVVINGADPSIFFPQTNPSSAHPKIRIVATSWSDNWRKGFDVYEFLDKHLDFDRYEFTFIGNSRVAFQKIKKIAPLNSKELAANLRQQDIYLTASVNDPCSNALIEAINCGLPCLVRNSGGHPEILQEGGLTFQGCEDVLSVLEKLNAQVRQRKEKLPHYSIQKSAQQYLAFMASLPNPKKSSLSTLKIAYLYALTYLWHTYVYCTQALSKRYNHLKRLHLS